MGYMLLPAERLDSWMCLIRFQIFLNFTCSFFPMVYGFSPYLVSIFRSGDWAGESNDCNINPNSTSVKEKIQLSTHLVGWGWKWMLPCGSLEPIILIYFFYTLADKLLWQKGYIGKKISTIQHCLCSLELLIGWAVMLSRSLLLNHLLRVIFWYVAGGCASVQQFISSSVSQSRFVIGQGWKVKVWGCVTLCHCDSGSSVYLSVWPLQLPLYSVT